MQHGEDQIRIDCRDKLIRREGRRTKVYGHEMNAWASQKVQDLNDE